MSYFHKHYKDLSYPIADNTNTGLRNAQIGAIHAIASHFTVHEKEPAVVVMPTGAGKTAVLFLSAFVLRAKRVLVITPSKLVRNQIAEGFGTLDVLIRAKIFADIDKPRVKEVTEILDSQEKWDDLSSFDVIVSTPNSLPIIYWAVNPPNNLFDLVLIDEAHHSPAVTWNALLQYFSSAKKILFTATPFRRDKKEIKGRFIYNYPLAKAYEDGIFGTVDFIPVRERVGVLNDISIAKKAEEIFFEDKEKGFKHFLLIRTNTKKHAKELVSIYEKNTNLLVKRIDSTFNSKHVYKIIEQLKAGEIHGIICVDMLGEGFDFPNLKIAVIHQPHRSLAITLQFIGRFARTNSDKIGSAKFLAIPNEINFMKLELYQEGAIWKDIIQEVSHIAIQNEVEVREVLQQFESQEVDFEDDRDISLYSLKPFYHVKIFESNSNVDIKKQVLIPDNSIDKHFVSDELSVAVFLTKEINKPKWLITEDLLNVNFNLFIIFNDSDNGLLYINSTKKSVDVYTQIAEQYLLETPKQLPLSLVHKVIANLNNPEVFNLGLRSKNTVNSAESYLIKAGSHVQNSIKPNELKLYEGGHLFLRGQEDGDFKTIGYSSASKVWSNTTSQIIDFIKWCNLLSAKINSNQEVRTNTDIDRITFRKVVSSLPADAIFAVWGAYCFKNNLQFHYDEGKGGPICEGTLIDLNIEIIGSDNDQIVFIVGNEIFTEKYVFTLDNFFQIKNEGFKKLFVIIEDEVVELSVFLNEQPIIFYFKDFSSVRLNEISDSLLREDVFFDLNKATAIDWRDTNITSEFTDLGNGKPHVHDKLKSILLERRPNVLIYDHGTGEIADFILIQEFEDYVMIELYHCKGAGDAVLGNRVGDFYEVCGQAIKSTIWTNIADLKNKLKDRFSRAKPSQYLVGDDFELKRMLFLNKVIRFKIFAVQPGLAKNNIEKKISEILAATEAYVENGDSVKFGIMIS